MNLKTSKNMGRSSAKEKQQNGHVNKSASKNVPVPAIKVKEEVVNPEEELLMQRTFKVELEEEETFDAYLDSSSAPFHQESHEGNFDCSTSGSENSSSSSPSLLVDNYNQETPLESHSPYGPQVIHKGNSPIINVSSTTNASGGPSSFPQIFLIGSRPYQLVNQQIPINNNEFSSREVMSQFQLRFLPSSNLQQSQQQLQSQPSLLKLSDGVKHSEQQLSNQVYSQLNNEQQNKSLPSLRPKIKSLDNEQKKGQEKNQSSKLQNQQKLHKLLLTSSEIQQISNEQKLSKHTKEKTSEKHLNEQQVKKKQSNEHKVQEKQIHKPFKNHLQQKLYQKESSSSIMYTQHSHKNKNYIVDEPEDFLECNETFEDPEEEEEEEEEDNSLPMDDSTPGGDSDYQLDQTSSRESESQQEDTAPSGSQGYPNDCSIPNLMNDAGVYGFKILLDVKEDTMKTPTWLVSDITKKLYTNMNKPIPFRVFLDKVSSRKKFFLRAMAVFKYPMFLMQNVTRCPNHMNPLDTTNIDFQYPNHVIRADHPHAVYESSSSGRLSVVVPLDFPESKGAAIPVLLKFMCHNSCVGGISRRPMAVLLTLEHNSEEVGRYTIDVRVCACPSRDVKTEEKQAIAKGLYKQSGQSFHELRRNRKRQRKEDGLAGEEDDQLFYLPVRGITLYNYLIDIKTSYLKHHPEYASKYPDPPNDLPWKITEEVAPQNLIGDPGEEVRPPESPNSTSSIPFTKEKRQSVFMLYSNNGNKDMSGSGLVSVADGIPELKKSSLDNLDAQLEISDSVVPFVKIKKEEFNGKIIKKDEDMSLEHRGANKGQDFTTTSPSSVSQYKSTKRKKRSVSKEPELLNSIERKQGRTKILNSPKFSGHHLSVFPMPEQNIKKNGLVRAAGTTNVKMDLQEPSSTVKTPPSPPSTEESDKVMLAAQVLASHLGSHQIDK